MLGLILDTMIIMVLIRLITGDENDGWGKPAIIAVLASITFIVADLTVMNAEPATILIVLAGTLALVGVFVFLGCWLLLGIEPLKALLVAFLFLVYKVLFLVLIAFAFASLGG